MYADLKAGKGGRRLPSTQTGHARKPLATNRACLRSPQNVRRFSKAFFLKVVSGVAGQAERLFFRLWVRLCRSGNLCWPRGELENSPNQDANDYDQAASEENALAFAFAIQTGGTCAGDISHNGAHPTPACVRGQ